MCKCDESYHTGVKESRTVRLTRGKAVNGISNLKIREIQRIMPNPSRPPPPR